MKQKIELELTQRPELDMIDVQELAAGCERTAEKLIKKHDGDFEKISKEVDALEVCVKDEILWATRQLLSVA